MLAPPQLSSNPLGNILRKKQGSQTIGKWFMIKYIVEHILSILSIEIALILAEISMLFSFYGERAREFKVAYSEFANILIPFIRDLDANAQNFDWLIKNNYREHEVAWRKFKSRLHGRRLTQCENKWLQYQKEHEKVIELDRLSAASPFSEDFNRYKQMSDEMWNAVNDRRKGISEILSELLDIAKN